MRRVEIARALLHRPRLLVLDEPTVGLDVTSRADILHHVRHLVAEDGIAVLWATHLIDEIDPAIIFSCCIRDSSWLKASRRASSTNAERQASATPLLN